MKVDSDCMNCPVKPFRFVTLNKLPEKLCNVFKVSWGAILLEMFNVPCLVLPNASDSISSETIDSTFGLTSDCLKSKHGCFFVSKTHLNWVVNTWNRKITASNIKKVGDKSDVQLLGDVRVNCHKKFRKRKSASGYATKKKRFFFALLSDKGNDANNSKVEVLSNSGGARIKVFDV